MEGVWQERRRLEAELGARREEAERLKASEDAARTASTILEGRVEDLSVALRQTQARAKRDAKAAVAKEARDATEALRRQLDDLRREVDRTKQDQAARSTRTTTVGAGGPTVGESSRAAFGLAAEGGGEARRKGQGGVGAMPAASGAVLEGEFQRLRGKYEKAKGRIAALEELVAASRRVSVQARKEFQVRAVGRSCVL